MAVRNVDAWKGLLQAPQTILRIPGGNCELVAHTVFGRYIIQGLFILCRRIQDLCDPRRHAVLVREEHRFAVRARYFNVPQTVLFFVRPCELVFFDEVGQVVVYVIERCKTRLARALFDESVDIETGRLFLNQTAVF